ncbi:uncharacterized protein LOC119180602 isoform X1 [Rhipicephalus microplus]|uniref:uncharacterized protein LOC119180602 isoform X1 n=1 Tax=Rhipicephalus microplus TaxID=6941 RepID=UPI003F6B66B9
MRAFWIFGVTLLIQTLTLVKTQRYSDLEDFHHYARPARQHVSLLGGIRPSRSSLVSARCVNPRLYFRNGLTRLRFRGRVVKYICRPGYTLIGDSVSTCNAGRWDRPVPICAAPGCRLPTRDLLPRGTVENVRGRGLMLRFRCRLGYTLRGGATAFCDGRAWNGSRPVCLPSISDPDPSCDFEALDQCGWSSDLSSGVQFSRQHDHEDDDVEPSDNVTSSFAAASGSSPSGHYMALESLGHRLALQDLNLPAQLVSPPYRPLRFRACFRFWYRLSCNLCTLQLLLWNSTNQTPLWSSYGPRKGGWANVELPETTEYFQLVFAARTRQPGEGGVAIDDVRLGPECQDVPTAEPPPATTTLLPDDVTTELDSGDTWDTTPYSSLPAVGGTESSSDNASSLSSRSIDNVAVTHGPEQRSSENLKPVTTKNESDVQPRYLQTTAPVDSSSSSSSATHTTPFPSDILTTSLARTESPSATAALTTSQVTSLPTRAGAAARESSHTTYTPFSPTTYSTSASFSRKTEVTTAAIPTTARLITSSSPKPSTVNVTSQTRTAAASRAFVASTSRTTSGAVLTTAAPTPGRRPVTTVAWLHPTSWHNVHPNVEGNTVGPDVTPVKSPGSKATTSAPYTRSRITSGGPAARSRSTGPAAVTLNSTDASRRTTHPLPQSTKATRLHIASYTTANLMTASSTVSARLPSSVSPIKGPATGAVSVTEATTITPHTKPTKPRKKATEFYTKPAKWTTRKPVKKSGDSTTSPPDIRSSTPLHSSASSSSRQTFSLPHSTRQLSSEAPKFKPADDSNLVKVVTKPSGVPTTSSPRSKNDEGNGVMLNDISGMPVLQEKHSAAAPASTSAWSVPALLIAAGILVTALAIATALYRCRRRYRDSADDSEMRPLSKHVDDSAELSS